MLSPVSLASLARRVRCAHYSPPTHAHTRATLYYKSLRSAARTHSATRRSQRMRVSFDTRSHSFASHALLAPLRQFSFVLTLWLV